MNLRLSTLDLLMQFKDPSAREGAAHALAERLGVETALLMVRDPALEAFIPVAGLPPTLRGGPTWRAFLKRCSGSGRFSAEVELPRNMRRFAEAVVVDGTALILLGGKLLEAELRVAAGVLPLLAAMLAAEHAVTIAHAESAAARAAAERAHALTRALDLARTEAATLNAELRDEHRRKDEFLATLAHELRNPLSPVVTSLDLLRRHTVDPAVLKKLVNVMTRQTGQLKRLLDDLLEVSRIRHGRIELQPERVVLRKLIDEALDGNRALIEAKQHQLEIVCEDEQLSITADRVRLTQIFGNLLDNAARYTEPGGRLTLRMHSEDDSVVIDLQDTGVGIDAEMLPRVFDLFTQAPVAIGYTQGGLGIGLAMVRTLVHLHGGHVAARSAGTGQGSTFSVRLPLADSRVAPERRERARLSH